jgi:Curlin associated repeat
MKTRLTKIAIAMLAVVMSVGVFAADNSIYIDQSGSNSTISITQDGYGNVVKGINSGSTTPATIYGINNAVTVNQVGISNTLSLGIQTTTGGTTTLPDGSTVSVPTINYSVTGNSNTGIIDSNNSGSSASQSNYIDITQTGNSSYANANVSGNNNAVKVVTSGGDSNSVTTKVNGNNNSQNISMTGGGSNTANIGQGDNTQASNGNTVGIASVGVSDSFTVNQTGGTNGNMATVQGYSGTGTASVGSSNTVTITQSGGNDNTAVLSMTGSNNTVGITQTATAGNNVANLKVNGSSNGITVTQTNR